MLKPAQCKLLLRARGSAFERFRRDRRGVSALEFALLAPIMLAMFTGLAVLTTGIMSQQRVNEATEGIGDSVSQKSNLQQSDMVNMFTAAGYYMAPFSGTPMSMRITNVYYDGNSSHNYGLVYWSCATGTLSPYAYNQQFTTIPGTSGPVSWVLWVGNGAAGNSSFIQVESSYIFTSPASWFLSGSTTLTSQFAIQPRLSNYVGFPYVTGTTPTAPASTTKSNTVTLSNGAVCKYGS